MHTPTPDDETFCFDDMREALKAAMSGTPAPLVGLLQAVRASGSPGWNHAELTELGNGLIQIKRFDDAAWAFGHIRALWPDDSVGWRGGALVAAHMANWEQCASYWEQSIARCPAEAQQPWWLTAQGEAHMQIGQTSRANEIYASLRERWPDDPAGWRGGAQIAAQRGDWEEAADFWRASLARTSENDQPLWIWASLADVLLKQQEFDNAAATYAVVRARWPGDSLGWRGGAIVASQQGQWQDAARLWRHCIDITPADVQLSWWYISLAEVLLRLDLRSEAEEIYASLRARWPEDPAGWRDAARLIAATRGWRRSMRYLAGWRDATGVSASPDQQAEYILALFRAGETAEAWQETEAFCANQFQDHRAIKLIAEVSRLSGDPRRALSHLVQFTDPASFRSCPTWQIAAVLYDAGLTKKESCRLLSGWFGSALDASVLESFYSIPRAGHGELLDAEAVPRVRKHRLVTKLQLRHLLTQFLRDRSYPCFEALATAAIEIADPVRANKLLRLAEQRFPRSRLALQLRAFTTGGAQPLSADDNAFAYRWRKAMPDNGSSIAQQLAGRPWRRLVCVVMVRDEDEMLPRHIAHHAALGVESFIVLDNGSQNDPATLLTDFDELEITVLRVPGAFIDSRHGTVWLNEILESGCCDWLLFVDCDEFLVFPGDSEVRLPKLLDHFEARNETAMFAMMLDVFDEGFAQGGTISSKIEDHVFFHANVRLRPSLAPPWFSASGGVRGVPQFLFKTPLVRAASGVRYTDNHCVSQCRRAIIRGALIHYKIYRDRALFAMEPEDVIVHRRVKDRGKDCIFRHVAMAQLRVPLGPEQAFNVPFSANRLLALGYMEADDAWRHMLDARLPADRMATAQQVHRPFAGPATELLSSALYDMALPDMLRQIWSTATGRERSDLRRLLNAHITRIGPREVQYAVLLYAAEALGRRRASRRLLRRVLDLLNRSGGQLSLHALVEVAVALGPHSAAAEPLAKGIIASGTEPHGAANVLAAIYVKRGEFAEVMDIFRRTDPLENGQSIELYLRELQRLRDWNSYHNVLYEAFTLGRIPPRRYVLRRLNMLPNDVVRLEFLEYFHSVLVQRVPDLDGEGISTLLATSHLLKRNDEFAALYARNEACLPPICRSYFRRLLDSSMGAPPQNRAWCVGLSKTGTTSFHTYCNDLGLVSAHWTNPVLHTLLDRKDGELFDVVSDSTVTFMARRYGVPEGRKVIATTREFTSWSRSFMLHFQFIFGAPGASFQEMQAICAGEEEMGWGRIWHEIHHELYFRFRTLEESYDYHHEWLRGLKRERGEFFLEVPLAAEDEYKARSIQRFLEVEGRSGVYPHSNKRIEALAEWQD